MIKKKILVLFFQKILEILTIKWYDNGRMNMTEGGVP